MRTELNMCERRKAAAGLSRSQNSALIAQHSVLCLTLSALLLALSSDRKRRGQRGRSGAIFYPRFSILGFFLCALLLALCVPASAQEPKKVFRIGYLSGTDRESDVYRYEPFRAALRELGYIEGQNITLSGDMRRIIAIVHPELAAELVLLKVDVHRGSGRGFGDPADYESDQDHSHRFDGPWVSSCHGRFC